MNERLLGSAGTVRAGCRGIVIVPPEIQPAPHEQQSKQREMNQAVRVRDGIDEMLDLWNKTLPGVDVSAVGVVLRISRLSILFGEELQKHLRPFGVGMGELDVLLCIFNTGAPYELRPSDISKGCYVTTGATTGRVDRLITAGLAERSPSSKDRRETLVRLTPEGRKMAQKLKREVVDAASVNSVLADMGPHDRAEFIRLLRTFHMRFQQQRGSEVDGATLFGARL